MPEFVREGRDHAARAESDFVLGFLEALFFTSCDSGTDSGAWFGDDVKADREAGYLADLPCDVGYSDLHPDSLQAVRRFCEMWQEENAALLAEAYSRPGYDETQAGRDFLLTINGHGVGFWDRAELEAEGLGGRLSNAAGRGEVYAWFGDHVTYGDAPFVHVDL